MVVSIEQQDDGTWNRVYKHPYHGNKNIMHLSYKYPCTKEGYLFDKDNNPIIPRRNGGAKRKNKDYKRIVPYVKVYKHKNRKHSKNF